MNGGTTGGKGGITTTVTTLEALRAAVAGNAKAIIIISGTITGSCVILVGSNKSILGKDGNARGFFPPLQSCWPVLLIKGGWNDRIGWGWLLHPGAE